MEGVEQSLRKAGWHLKPAFFEDHPEQGDARGLLSVALNSDLKDCGLGVFREDRDSGLTNEVPVVVQVQRVRNVLSSRAKEHKTGGNPNALLRVQLTDGPNTRPALAFRQIKGLSLKTPPGTKICLRSQVNKEHNFAILTPDNCVVLGGQVDELVEKWKIATSESMSERLKHKSDAPPWVPFGKKIQTVELKAKADGAGSELKKDESEAEFDEARRAAIASAAAAARNAPKPTAAPSVFNLPTTSRPSSEREAKREERKHQQPKPELPAVAFNSEFERPTGRGGRRGRGRFSQGDDEADDIGGASVRPSTLFDFIGGVDAMSLDDTANQRFDQRNRNDDRRRDDPYSSDRGGRGARSFGGRRGRGPGRGGPRDYRGGRPFGQDRSYRQGSEPFLRNDPSDFPPMQPAVPEPRLPSARPPPQHRQQQQQHYTSPRPNQQPHRVPMPPQPRFTSPPPPILPYRNAGNIWQPGMRCIAVHPFTNQPRDAIVHQVFEPDHCVMYFPDDNITARVPNGCITMAQPTRGLKLW